MHQNAIRADRCPVVHFDHHSPEHARTAANAYRQLREEAPVCWTDTYGGFWVVSRYEDVAQVARDDATFSSLNDTNSDDLAFSGVIIPPAGALNLPIEIDPPLLGMHRKLLAARMAPKRAREMHPTYVNWADYFIDRFIERGEVEFVSQLASPVPTLATLEFLGLPLEDYQLYSKPFHDFVAYPAGTDEYAAAVAQMMECLDRVEIEVEDRRRHPRDDALTDLVHGEVDGARLGDEDIRAWVRLVLGGGIDTTTSLISHSLVYLDQRFDLRVGLRNEPKALELFMEEMLRVATPTQALARTATRDVMLGGQLIKRGDRVLVSWASANRDDDVFDDAEDIVIDRRPNPHTSFGLGPHRCIGSHFARAEYLAVMDRVLRRLPDYRLTDGASQYDSIGTVNGWRTVPATFTPGEKQGSVTKLALPTA